MAPKVKEAKKPLTTSERKAKRLALVATMTSALDSILVTHKLTRENVATIVSESNAFDARLDALVSAIVKDARKWRRGAFKGVFKIFARVKATKLANASKRWEERARGVVSVESKSEKLAKLEKLMEKLKSEIAS